MKLDGEYLFNGPREEVWKLVRDPDVLATALPGTQSLNKISDTEFEGVMHLKIGPMAGDFSGRLVVSAEVPPESCTLTVDGKGAAGFARGVGHVQLIEQADGKTLVKYTGDLTVGGKLASTGQRMIETVSKSMVRQGLEALDKALQARVAAQAENREVEYEPPTEIEFASAVARDVAQSTLSSPEVRIALYIIPVITALVILILILCRRRRVGE
jgi:carbon monoxide dehydrogenase subunit G